jgi:hypothetical protein
MQEMSSKFDELLAVQGHPIFQGYKDFLRDRAISHAEREYAAYKLRIKTEAIA